MIIQLNNCDGIGRERRDILVAEGSLGPLFAYMGARGLGRTWTKLRALSIHESSESFRAPDECSSDRKVKISGQE